MNITTTPIVQLKFKKLHTDAVLPTYAKHGDAGMDCYSVSDPIIKDTYIGYQLGIAVEIPFGYVGLMFPRSSVSNTTLSMANCVGVIDSGYRGEIQARFKSHSSSIDNIYKKGDKVCQMIVMPVPTMIPQWVDELSDSDRGTGGFGSTGN